MTNKETKKSISEEYVVQKDILDLWEQTVCEIRSEIKAQDTPALVYAKELCDKLEHSMCALAGGHYKLRYSIEECLTETSQEIMEMRKHVAKLEKENAELKSELSMLKTSDW